MGLFFISFGASALHRIFKAGWTTYLIRNRRYYGISTAIVLWAHFLVILSLSVYRILSGSRRARPGTFFIPGTV